jgi:hypothetical protein
MSVRLLDPAISSVCHFANRREESAFCRQRLIVVVRNRGQQRADSSLENLVRVWFKEEFPDDRREDVIPEKSSC